MKNLKTLFAGLSFLILLAACTGNFEEINEDPNRIAEISPGTLINPIIYGLASHNAGRAHGITFDLMQVTLPFPSVSGGLHRYDVSQNIGNSLRTLLSGTTPQPAAANAGSINSARVSDSFIY